MADKYTVVALDSAVYTNAANWVGAAAPTANDNIYFQHAGTLDGSDQSATELDDIHILPECTGTIGSPDTYLQLDQGTSNAMYFAGGGTSYIDLGTAGSALVRVDRTKAARNNKAGLYLRNVTNAITTLQVQGGVVRLDGETASTVTTANVSVGATLIIGEGATIATVNNNGGVVLIEGAITSLYNTGGVATFNGTDAATLVQVTGGTVLCNTSGTITTATVDAGTLDFSGSRLSRTVTTLNVNGGNVKGLDTGHITIGTLNLNVPCVINAA